MPLDPGTTLGPYEIQAPLGAGGMGAAAGVFVATRALVTLGGAIAGGYIGAWLYDG